MLKIPTAALLLLAAACGGGGEFTALEGVYTIDEWTENPDGCAAPGPSVLVDKTESALYVKTVKFFGQSFINAATCATISECQERAASDTIELGGFALETGSDADGWQGSGYFLGGDGMGGPCSGQVIEYQLRDLGDGTIELDRRGTDV